MSSSTKAAIFPYIYIYIIYFHFVFYIFTMIYEYSFGEKPFSLSQFVVIAILYVIFVLIF
jgi:hypothetical protein